MWQRRLYLEDSAERGTVHCSTQGFNLGKKLREEKLRLPERKCGTATHGEDAEGVSSSCTGGPGSLPQGNFEHLHAPRCNLVYLRPKKLLLQSL